MVVISSGVHKTFHFSLCCLFASRYSLFLPKKKTPPLHYPLSNEISISDLTPVVFSSSSRSIFFWFCFAILELNHNPPPLPKKPKKKKNTKTHQKKDPCPFRRKKKKREISNPPFSHILSFKKRFFFLTKSKKHEVYVKLVHCHFFPFRSKR